MKVISTGSVGNCIIINDLMFDCGVPYKKIKEYIDGVKFIFIGHIHSDHFNPATIKKIAFEKPNMKFIVGYQIVKPLIDCGVTLKNIFFMELEQKYHIGDYIIKLDYLIHDVPNCCIHVEFPDGRKMIYATDTSSINHVVAENYDYALIEANYYTNDELDEKIKEAKEKGEFTHLERVKKTHLSQLDALNWLQKNNIKNYKFIHEHREEKNEDN